MYIVLLINRYAENSTLLSIYVMIILKLSE